MLGLQPAKGQSDSIISIYIANDTILANVQQYADSVVSVFADTNINSITKDYVFKVFEKQTPRSRFSDLRRMYKVVCSNTYVAERLKTVFPGVFPYYEVSKAEPLYTPDDWVTGSYSSTWALKFIHAEEAWTITHGDPNVIVGVTDTYFDLDNPDFAGKVAFVDVNNPPTPGASEGRWGHGTMSAGRAVAATDNGIGYAAIGFDCRLRLSSEMTDDAMFDMSLPGPFKARVLNASWRNGHTLNMDMNYNLATRIKYNEIYENGVVTCVAAGNGQAWNNDYTPPIWDGPPRYYYVYPASYDHVISTTHVNGIDCSWATLGSAGCCCDAHDRDHGDTSTAPGHRGFNANPRVDICAPAELTGGLTLDRAHPIGDDLRHYCYSCGTGTSFASPMTAGTIALMASSKACMSPYQLEWALKNGARSEIYSVPENAYYDSPKRLGAGALHAGNALNIAAGFDCNDVPTQTFHVRGVKINTLCAPGYSSGTVAPTFTPVLENGVPPYTYVWASMPGNTTTLDDYSSPTPTITGGTGNAFYYLTVYDNSPVQKVANKTVQFVLTTDNTYQLASRDSYMDMLDQPNTQAVVDPREDDYWHSPDIWNRLTNDGGTEPQDAEYFSTGAPNYMYVRVRNVGCADYTTDGDAVLHTYWTLASTGENWPADWNWADIPVFGGGSVPAGREITVGAPVVIPNIASGSEYIAEMPWNPVNPAVYSTSTVEICGLARIKEPEKAMDGMAYAEIDHTTTNVKNNHNIVTRNMGLVNLGRKQAPRRTRRVYVSNVSSSIAREFSLQMLTERDIQLHFAGNPSQYMYVALHMDSVLFDRWATAGHLGSYASYSTNERTVYYDPATPLRLDSIVLDTMEKHYIDIEFTLRDGVPVRSAFAPQTFHFRQLTDTATADSVYGNVSFMLGIEQDDTVVRRGVLAITELTDGPTATCQAVELLVANCGVNMADSVDIRGWVINDNSGILFGGCDPSGVNPGHLRLAYHDHWARVPAGSLIVLYNYAGNCYNLPDTLTYNADSGVYWIPIGANATTYVEQYNGTENSEVCSYCSDTGATVYKTPDDWMAVVGMDREYDGIQTLCPGCKVDIPGPPLFYNGVAHVAELEGGGIYALGSGSSLGLIGLENNDVGGGYKYVFTGNTGEELKDYTKWVVAVADTAGIKPPTLGNVAAPVRELVTAHELDLPCCIGAANEGGGEESRPARGKDNTRGIAGAEAIRVFPNPASSTVHFEFPYAAGITICIMDVTGKVMERQTLHNTGRAAFDVRGYTPGLYMYQAVYGNSRQMGKVVIVR